MNSNMGKPRTWLVTGVSGGIGRAVAELALQQGDTVWGSLRQASQAAAFEALAPGRARALVMDVTQPAQIASAVAQVLAAGGLDVLVNNAGIGMVGAVEETSIDEARAVFETNVFGLLQVTQACLPTLRQQRSGHIINLSSGVGLQGMPGMPIYSASKHAVEGLTEALAAEVAPLGIRVSLVEPGAILTNFTGAGMIEAARKLPEYAAFSGYGRAGLAHYYQEQALPPETVAKVVLELASHPQPPLRRLVGEQVVAAAEARLLTQQQLLADSRPALAD